MTKVSSSLAELVHILNDGIEFYHAAAGKVSDPALSQFFQRMSYLKKTIASDLNAEIAMEGDKPVEAGSFFGGLRLSYADMLGKLSDKTASQYVAELEAHEDSVIAAFRDAVLQDPSSRVRELAQLYFPEIDKMHAEMRSLKTRGVTG